MRKLIISIVVLNLSLILPGSALRSQTEEQDRRLTPDGELVDLALRRSVVLIKINPVYYNQAMPWVREAGQSYTVMGLVMTGNRILMLGHDVRRAALLEVTKFSSYEPAIAEIDLLDMETNLALLKVRDPDFFDDLIPVPTGEDPELSSQASAIKVDQLFRVYREKVQVTELKTVADYGFTHLPVIIFRSDESFRYGGLLLCKTRVCGFIGYSDQEKRNESIPASVIATFRKRAAENDYSGFVAQGLVLESLVDPVRREYYHLPGERGGVLVSRTLPGTSVYGAIQPEDVILSIDGTPIDNLGFYEDPKLGRQHINLLLARKGSELRRPGDRLVVGVWRDGREQQVRIELRSYAGGAERIPWLVEDAPNYIVENGIVFLELSVPLMRQLYGSDWRKKAIQLSYLFETERYYEKAGEQDRIVIIAGVLPDHFTRGYDDLNVTPVTEINGEKIVNLAALREKILKLEEQGADTAALTLSSGAPIYIDIHNRRAINQRILGHYGIPAASSWDQDTQSQGK